MSGEESGFKHLIEVASRIKHIDKNIIVSAMGYPSKYIDNLIIDISDRAEMGLAEVIKNTGYYLKSIIKLTNYIERNKPDVVIPIDNFEFNMFILKEASRKSKGVYYLIPPKVWAWGGFRVNILKKYCKKVYTIFKFESDFLKRAGLNAEYIGNPFLNLYKDIRNNFNREMRENIIGLLPGSRQSEIRNHLPKIIEAVNYIRRSFKNVHFIIGSANNVRALIENMIKGADIEMVDGIRPVLEKSYIIIVASGTATIETAICGIPMVIIYHTSPITYLIGRLLIKTKFIGLPNIISGKEIAPELLQNKLKPESISESIIKILNNTVLYENMRKALLKITDENFKIENDIYTNLIKDIKTDVGF
ncbi:MAG: lipid-A-disaccharide synthase [bacterium]